MTNLNLQFHRDTQGRKWLVMVMGSGTKLEIPDDVYGIAGGAFISTTLKRGYYENKKRNGPAVYVAA